MARGPSPPFTTAVLRREEARADRPALVIRQDGDANLLVEYGPPVLDLALRFRVHALAEMLADRRVAGILDLTPGIRSLHVHYDDRAAAMRKTRPPLYPLWKPPVLHLVGHFLRNGVARTVPVAETSGFTDQEVLDVPGRPRVIHPPGPPAGRVFTWPGPTLLLDHVVRAHQYR